MLKRKSIYAWISVLMVSISGFCMDTMNGDEVRTPQKLRIGTTISVFGGLEGLTYENLKEARSARFNAAAPFRVSAVMVSSMVKPI